MPSVVTICNTALSHIGDVANVSSIDPPDASQQAAYCSKFYPVALSAILEMATWGFATVRTPLAQVDNPSSTWLYAYASPNKVINLISVLPSDALDDYSATLGATALSLSWPHSCRTNPADNFYEPQPYAQETDSKGNQIILTNVESAVLRYTTLVTDPTKFSPLFVLALTYLLASMLAGPIIKGDAGATKASEMLKLFQVFETQAEASDANQHKTEVRQSVPWMAGR